MPTILAKWLLAAFACCVMIPAVQAADLTGAWADNTSECGKIFVKKGASISFASDADLYGSGLVFEKNRILGKIASCNIKSQKQDGDVLHIIGICSTDVALQTVQLSLKMDGDNTIVRIFPGLPELQMRYSRCAF
jgi:hypothetical protein